MELKDQRKLLEDAGFNPFQSHLYGIERIVKLRNHEIVTVFQSHLYGIERYHVVVRSLKFMVSIAPLWN